MASILHLKYKDIKYQLSSHSNGLYCYLIVTFNRQKLQNMLYYYYQIQGDMEGFQNSYLIKQEILKSNTSTAITTTERVIS